MTVKTAVSFTDRHHQFARKKVEEGSFASVSSLVAAGIEQVMHEEIEREAALDAMKETIKRRMETPRSEWVEFDDSDPMFAKAKAYLSARKL